MGVAQVLAERACRDMPLDWLWTGDDVAGQTGMILSPEAWRDLIKPLRRVPAGAGGDLLDGGLGVDKCQPRTWRHGPADDGDDGGQ